MKINSLKIIQGSLFVLVLLTFSFMTWKKASHAGFTHDEAVTVNQMVPQSVIEIVNYDKSFTNNHILNTLLIKTSTGIFGNTELAARLPNLLAHLAFIVFTFLISFRFLKSWIAPFAFVLMNANPYLLDFFALARGYGLAIGLMTASLYFFFLHVKGRKQLPCFLSLGFAILATMANFALLLVFAALIITYQVILLMEKPGWKKWLRDNVGTLTGVALLALVIWEPMRLIARKNMIDFGGSLNFWDDTVMSLIHCSLFSVAWESWWLVLFVAVVLFHKTLMSVTWIVAVYLKGRVAFFENRMMLSMNLVLLLVINLHLFQHYCLGTPFLMDRFALFLVPLFVLNLLFLVDFYSEIKFLKWVSVSILAGMSILMSYHTVSHFSMEYYKNWKNDRDIRLVLEKIDEDRQRLGLEKVSLGNSWEYEPVLNYYRVNKKLTWLEPVTRKEISQDNDYYFIDFYQPRQMPFPVDTLLIIRDWPSIVFRNRASHPGK